ncbi:hypothetical protein B296_00009165 [Ensete ventricosum]|uniref:ABC transporter domain-containing protein n=1 Tax=Ensete ventricosum TaxID=4639 RepID=A0A427A3E1_ENSVE|nr:hypothetical protein B296_00009165 [Ensete ventricosum]
MLVGPARALFMDEISTGLDSSTTFQIVNSLRQSIHILSGTAMISLLQPAPETYDLFDDIILLSDGLVVYQGPRDNVLEFFESMGFRCPERKGVADFLQEVALGDELSVPFDKNKSHPAALTTTRYGVSNKEVLKANIDRELLLMKRNSFVYIFKATQLTIMAIVAMTVFLRTKMPRETETDGLTYLGALFFAVVMVMFNGFSELAMTLMKLPVFFKQRDLLFYPAWSYTIPTWILKIPIAFVEVAVWVFTTYYVIGFDPNVGRTSEEMVDLGLLDLATDLRTERDIRAGFDSSVLSFAAYGKSQPPISEETLKEKHINLTGEGLESSSRGRKPMDHSASKSKSRGHAKPMLSKSRRSESENGTRRKDSSLGSMKAAFDQNRRGMVLPFTPLSITFDDIRYSVDMPQEMKAQGVAEDRLELLKGVSGSFRPGVLTALMGVSGAGKTTLMDVLAGRKTGGYIEGTINISGYPKKQETFARISGYCEQNDIHSPHVTVYESIVYSAWLRLPPEVDSETRKMFVDEVMELVELTPLRDALVGLPGVDGLSTEQRKRLTIAVELVANPSIIFMDEPTSGLDARAAAIVMRTVRNTVDTGRTVVCTIHQPSIDIFEAFDEGINGVSKIKDGYNPATWMLEVTAQAQEGILGVDFSQVYKNSELYQRNKRLIEELSIPPPGSSDLYFPTQYSQSMPVQCMACLWKQHLSYWRNPPYTAKKIDLFNAMGSMYAAVIFIGVQNCSSVQPVVAVERTVFYRERAAGMYSALPYAFGQALTDTCVLFHSQVVIELPYVLIQSMLYGVIVYAMIGFEWTVAKFFWYIFFMYFTLLYFTFYGMMTVGITPNHNIAAIVSAAFYGLWNLFSGFIVPRPVSWETLFTCYPAR